MNTPLLIAEKFKELVKETSNEVDTISLKVNTVKDWLHKFGTEDLTKRDLIEVPDPPTKETTEAEQLTEEIKNIVSTNNKIINNNINQIEEENNYQVKDTITGNNSHDSLQ